MISISKIFYRFCKINNKTKNLYETLKLTKNASQQQIKANYYKLAKQYHPDSNPKYTQLFKEINEAYQILKDPTKKGIYDSQNFTQKGSPKTTTYYNTQHDYGNIYRKKQNYKSSPYGYGQNPYQSSTNHYGVEMNQFLKQEYLKNIHQSQKKLKKQRETLNNIMSILFGIVAILMVGQMMIKVYQFNNLQKKYSYPQKLDPRDFK